MTWILWALMLVAHGAYSRWVETSSRFALASVLGDVLLIAIALITLDQMQRLDRMDILRLGIFFAAFGFCGRQLMTGLIRHQSSPVLSRSDR